MSDLLRVSKGIPQSANFEAVVAYIEQSDDNTYPVVDDRMRVVGAIRCPLLSNAMFDHSVKHLVRAEDFQAASTAFQYPDDPATRAFALFQAETDDCIPVVSPDASRELPGVGRRSDVMHALITQHRKATK